MATDYDSARELMLASVLPAGSDVYIALWDGDPINGGAELTLTGYARVAFQNWSTSSLPGTSTRSNAAAIVFPTITAAGQATHWAIHDDATEPSTLLLGGELLDNLDQPVPIIFGGGGDDVQFIIGALRVEVVS